MADLGCFTIVAPTDRAVIVTLGQAADAVLQPGIHAKLPIVSTAKKYSIAPRTYDLHVDIQNRGALSSDNQIIGAEAKVVWNYDAQRILEVVKGFPDRAALENIINNTAYEALKAEIGKYTIFELARAMPKIAQGSLAGLKEKLQPYPIVLQQFNITNFDWSTEFDKQVNATMAMKQQVEKARAEADRTEQEQRAKAIAAEASAKALVATAEGEKIAAELRAAARRAEGQGIADYNRLVSQNQELEIDLRRLDIEKARIEKWDGHYVSTYIPMPANGAIVSLPSVQAQK
jgi:regulator of protease activity HflC (stomatin/prohibitin superfamily)